MKKRIILFSIVNALAIFAVVGISTSRSVAQTSKTDPLPHTVLLHVNGMMCHACEAKVEGALKKVKGVTNPHANYSSGIVSMNTVGNVPQQKLIAAVKSAGFTTTAKGSTQPKGQTSN